MTKAVDAFFSLNDNYSSYLSYVGNFDNFDNLKSASPKIVERINTQPVENIDKLACRYFFVICAHFDNVKGNPPLQKLKQYYDNMFPTQRKKILKNLGSTYLPRQSLLHNLSLALSASTPTTAPPAPVVTPTAPTDSTVQVIRTPLEDGTVQVITGGTMTIAEGRYKISLEQDTISFQGPLNEPLGGGGDDSDSLISRLNLSENFSQVSSDSSDDDELYDVNVNNSIITTFSSEMSGTDDSMYAKNVHGGSVVSSIASHGGSSNSVSNSVSNSDSVISLTVSGSRGASVPSYNNVTFTGGSSKSAHAALSAILTNHMEKLGEHVTPSTFKNFNSDQLAKCIQMLSK